MCYNINRVLYASGHFHVASHKLHPVCHPTHQPALLTSSRVTHFTSFSSPLLLQPTSIIHRLLYLPTPRLIAVSRALSKNPLALMVLPWWHPYLMSDCMRFSASKRTDTLHGAVVYWYSEYCSTFVAGPINSRSFVWSVDTTRCNSINRTFQCDETDTFFFIQKKYILSALYTSVYVRLCLSVCASPLFAFS